jgi:hypothetical protein
MEKRILISLKKNKNGSYAVLLQHCKEGTFLKSAGLTLRLNQNQFIFYKKNKRLPSTLLNYEVYNSYLNQEVGKLQNQINKFFQTYKRYPSKDELEAYLKYNIGSNVSETDDFMVSLERFIERKSTSKDIKQYKTLYKHFEEFSLWSSNKRNKIYFSSLQVEFFKEFFIFLSKKVNQVIDGKRISKLAICDNGIAKLSYSLGSAINQIKRYKIANYDKVEILDNIRVAREELNITNYTNKEIVLGHEEVEVLCDFQPHDEYRIINGIKSKKVASAELLNKIKFLFILQTSKGIRHSDLHKLNIHSVFDSAIYIKQKKTGHQHNIRVNKTTIELMKLSSSEKEITNQRYNEYLKLLFKQFFPFYKENYRKNDLGYKLEGIPIIKYYLGAEKIEYRSRYMLVKTHTARRSYVSVAKIKHNLSDIEVQHDIGQINPSSLNPYKQYYEEAERKDVFDLNIKNSSILREETKKNQTNNDLQ